MEPISLTSQIVNSLPDGFVRQVVVGLMWTCVVVEVEGIIQGGIASSMQNPEYEHTRHPLVSKPGDLEGYSGRELAGLIDSTSYTEASIGLAAMNALVPRPAEQYGSVQASDWLAEQGRQKSVALVGHFHFTEELKQQVKKLWVLELDPRPGDLPARLAPEILPQADIVAITATTLINHTFEGLIHLCRPDARVMLLGPSTPLSPLLLDYGVDVLAGIVVEKPIDAARIIAQGGTSRQLKQYFRQVFVEK